MYGKILFMWFISWLIGMEGWDYIKIIFFNDVCNYCIGSMFVFDFRDFLCILGEVWDFYGELSVCENVFVSDEV